MAGSSTPGGRNRKCSAANIGAVNRRLDEAVAAGKAKSSTTSQVGNVKVLYEDGNLGPDALRNTANEG